jgi:YidC/Oxa1 family membrane protein insertase
MTHLTPKSGDPTQQRMMMFMPIIFIVFCYNFAAALALYYTTQNLLTVLQLYLNKRQPAPTLQRVDRGAKGKRR